MSTNFIEYIEIATAFHLAGSFVSLCIMLHMYFSQCEQDYWRPRLHQLLLIAIVLGWIFTLYFINGRLIERRNNNENRS